MRKVQDIGPDADQRHVLLFQETEITLTLRFFAPVERWTFDAAYKNFSIKGVALSLNTPHMESANQPFDFLVLDNSGQQIDPFRLEDFAEGRCSLYLLEPDDMAELRGAEVPL